MQLLHILQEEQVLNRICPHFHPAHFLVLPQYLPESAAREDLFSLPSRDGRLESSVCHVPTIAL